MWVRVPPLPPVQKRGVMAVEYLTTNQWAKKFNMHPQRVRDMCADGRIKALKMGKSWRIPYDDTPYIKAEQQVEEAVEQIVKPCVAVIDAAIESLEEMKGVLEKCKDMK